METLDKKTKQTLVRKTIWICWTTLLVCFIIKLFSGSYFEIIVNNKTFINFCGFIEKHYIDNIIKCILYCFSFNLIISIFSRSEIKSKKLKIFMILISIILWFIKREFTIVGVIFETALMFGLPLFISKEKKLKTFICSLVCYLVLNILQLISLFIRNINPIIIQENFIVGLICQIDYYIMLVLYYLYYVKMKGRMNMDWSVLWFAKEEAMDKGYLKFIKVMSVIGIVLTFPVSVPYLLWKKHKRNKMVKVKD